ncbi:hypothetical protein [Streptomyces cinereoruber]|uniref:hypothetical protein n=1 Tax=Streptomyces cinereoruber TaxID=67260 RepID=UPI003626AD72
MSAEKCCVCSSPDVVYRNYIDLPFCDPCANGKGANAPKPETPTENPADRLRAQLGELTQRARRVAISHEHFIQDHNDPGTEALAAQYELVNWLSGSEYHEGLPANPAESALRIILAQLDQFDENVTPGELRAIIAEALPREDMSDRRRRIYIDGRGNAWLEQSTASDGTRWVAPFAGSMPADAEPMDAVTERTGSLREIGRCW